MTREQVTDDMFEGPGEGIELALPGDMIMRRHIATRASNRRSIVVLVEGDSEFEGYSIGLDEHTLQLLDLSSGDVSSISLDYIVALSDGKLFSELTPEEMNAVDRRTASFGKTSSKWLSENWPSAYRRDDDKETQLGSTPFKASHVRPPRARYGGQPVGHRPASGGSATHAD